MKPLANGELRYAGRKVNPETCKFPVKDLRRLTGRCRSCGQLLRGAAAVPHPDPFADDVHADNTPVVQCSGCDQDSSDEI